MKLGQVQHVVEYVGNLDTYSIAGMSLGKREEVMRDGATRSIPHCSCEAYQLLYCTVSAE